MISRSAYRKKAQAALVARYGEREALSVVNFWLMSRWQLSRTGLVLQGDDLIDPASLDRELEALKGGVPVQYLLGEAPFLDFTLEVDASTLIPRPETEELVTEGVAFFKCYFTDPRVLDVGTGSGCIALGVKSLWPGAQVTGWDVQAGAVAMARKNALRTGLAVHFEVADVLAETLPEVDVVFSNPPYIPRQEWSALEAHVREREPEVALAVPDEDPLLFYREVARKALAGKNRPVGIAYEIHENFGKETLELLRGFDPKALILQQDLQGKDRMIFAYYDR